MTARRDEIEAAVATYDQANLPRNIARLLIAMFAASDVCQRSQCDLIGEGFSKSRLPGALRHLTDAGFLTRQRGTSRVPDTWRLHLPPVRQ
jgi:hypothetical protein